MALLEVTWSGLFAVAGVALAVWLAARWLRREGMSAGQVYGTLLWAAIGGLAGAKLFHIVDFWSFYWALPWKALYLWTGGLALWGGILGGAAGALLHLRLHGMPVWRAADLGALAALAGQAVGRIGDLLGGALPAKVTTLPWSLTYSHTGSASYSPDGVAVHPVAFYELLWDMAVLGILVALRRKLRPDGALFVGYLALYAAGRLAIGFARLGNVWFWGLQEAQVVSVVVLLAGVVFWLRFAKSPAKIS